MKKVGIVGGTFDPIHNGHLLLAEYAKEEFLLDEIWFIPTGCSYKKAGKKVLPGVIRYELVNRAIANRPDFKCLDIEIQRSGNTYTYETIQYLNEKYSGCEFYFIFGADCLFEIDKWKNPQMIFDGCEIIAAVRNDADYLQMENVCKQYKDRFQANIHLMNFLRMEISSTAIRDRLRHKKSVRYLVPEPVIDYIQEKGLYSDESL